MIAHRNKEIEISLIHATDEVDEHANVYFHPHSLRIENNNAVLISIPGYVISINVDGIMEIYDHDGLHEFLPNCHISQLIIRPKNT